jgi:predicted nucleotide-binding protein
MVSRKSPQKPNHANLTVEQMRKGVVRLERIIDEIESFDADKLPKRWSSEQRALEATIEGALASVFGHDTVEYRRYADATSLDHGPVSLDFGDGAYNDAHLARGYVAEGKANAVLIVKSAIKWLHDELGDAEEPNGNPTPQKHLVISQKIFIVHGHDDGARQTVARFIERIGFEAVILSEQANQGRTIIEKIEAHCDVGFAVVLLTPDDVGGKSSDALRPRARQNVLLELGYFMAHLGRQRVCALAKGDVEIPTDFAGVVWEPLDEREAWKTALARELKAAGYDIDWNKVMG